MHPAKYDDASWVKYLGKFTGSLNKDVLNELIDGPFPNSSDAFNEQSSTFIKGLVSASVSEHERADQASAFSTQTGMPTLDANRFLGLSDEKKSEEFVKFMENAMKYIFPRCYPELHPALINYLSTHFMFTPGGGKHIYYNRISDSPNIWEEAPVSPPFENSSGEFRATITALLSMTCSNEYLQVIAQDNNGNVKLHRQIPKYKMFMKYKDSIAKLVTGSQDAVATVTGYIDKFIEDSKRRCSGALTEIEIKRGVEHKIEMLHELDLQIPDITWCFRQEVHIANMTNDTTTPAFAYFDLNSLTPGETPNFDGFLTGVYPECRETLMAALYATFFAKSQLSQYLWLHGEGGDGKSSFLAAIAEFAGKRLACSLNQQAIKSDFGLEECVGKRIVIISDVKTGLTVKSGLIHNLTGHDPIWVNRKNRPGITVTFNPVVWIASNEAPDVDFANQNESRRCVYIRVRKPDKEVQKRMYFLDENGEIKIGKNGRPQFNGYDLKGGLVNEMPHILYKCKEAFDRLCPAPHNAIQQSDEAIELAVTNCIDIEADEIEYYLTKTFDFGNPKDKMKQTEVFQALKDCREQNGIKREYNQFEKRTIRRKLENLHQCVQKKIGGQYYLTGISKKLLAEEVQQQYDFTPVEVVPMTRNMV